MKNVKLAPSVDLAVLAARTPGFAGADLANLVNEATLRAAKRGKDAVDLVPGSAQRAGWTPETQG